MAAEEESLETLLNKATNPMSTEENWDDILAFCDQINKELEGPQIAVRLLAHKVQSPQEKEALLALSTLESCVKNCGKRFHQEIGKFRFLNELIKIVSPKYLGNHTTEKVKKKTIELLYSWGQGLKGEGKVVEAYQMLKRQGIVKQDPVYVDKYAKTIAPPSPVTCALFEDEDKSKLLSRLLRSKHPEDLQAANRLIKNMVKQDSERIEKVSKRVQQIETVNNNMKVLDEMLQHYRPGSASDAEKDLMKELYENLEKARPSLFRLASDTDDKDNEGIQEILKANDEVLAMMTRYKQMVDGNTDGLPTSDSSAFSRSELLDFGGGFVSADDSAMLGGGGPPSSGPARPSTGPGGPGGSLLLDDDVLGLIDMENDKSKERSVMSQLNKNDLDMLNDIFTSGTSTASSSTTATGDISLLSLNSPAPTSTTFPPSGSLPQPSVPLQPSGGAVGAAASPINWGGVAAQQGTNAKSTAGFNGTSLASSVFNTASPAKSASPQTTSTSAAEGKTFDAFEDLGKSLMQQSLSTVTVASTIPVATPNLTLNQMAHKSGIPSTTTTASASPAPLIQPSTGGGVPLIQPVAPLSPFDSLLGASQAPTPPASVTASPLRTPAPSTPAKNVEVKPLTDVTVPLESIQPSSHPPVTAFDKQSVKVVVHVGKDAPREDVQVMVLSIMSTNTSPIRALSFQAAVPKIMKVKLQPPSATDLPGYNPILPPTAITQVMLIANPLKEKIRLKFKLSYNIDGSTVTDVGDVDTFQVQ